MAHDPFKDYQEASLDGAPFHVRSSTGGFGRRVVGHTYPKKNETYTEDMGRMPRSFDLEAYVTGPEYSAECSALIAACEKEGPVKLVHPWLGSMEVICKPATVRHSVDEMGLVKFGLSFEEAGKRNQPAETPNFNHQANTQAATVRTTAAAAFSQVYSTLGPAWLATAAAGDVKGAFKLLTETVRAMPPPFDDTAVGEFITKVEEIAAKVEEVANNPEVLAETITNAIKDLSGLPAEGNAAAALDAAKKLADFGAPNENGGGLIGGLAYLPSIASTATRQKEADNRAAIVRTVGAVALSEAVSAAMDIDYAAYQDAKAERDALLTKLDAAIMEAGDSGADPLFHELTGLSKTLTDAFKAKAKTLPHLIEIEPPVLPVPSLVLAYDLYEDLDREAEIITRNGITNPGLPPAATPLMVLDA